MFYTKGDNSMSNEDISPVTEGEMLRKIGGLSDLVRGILEAITELNLDHASLAVFCRCTPNGKVLWRRFIRRRRSSRESCKGYGFPDFVQEVLRDAGHPVSM